MADSPFEAVSNTIKTIFDAEFAVEQFQLIHDELHESLGREYVAAGVAPLEDVIQTKSRIVQETWVEVKLYDLWTQEISPDTVVDPRKITKYAERFREALRTAQTPNPGTNQIWFFNVVRTQYPRDPTGNKTRFVMTICAYGNNSNLIETTA